MASNSTWSAADFNRERSQLKLGCSPNLLLQRSSPSSDNFGRNWIRVQFLRQISSYVVGMISSRFRSKGIVIVSSPWIPCWPTEQFLDDWSARIGQAPGDFVRRMIKDKELWIRNNRIGVRIRFYLLSNGMGCLSIRCRVGMRGVLRVIRSFDLNNAIVKHDYIRLRKRFRGKGYPIVAYISRNLIDGYDDIGIRTIKIEAGLELGGFIWAKRGFSPTSDSEWQRIKMEMYRRWSSIESIVRNLEPTIADLCEKTLTTGDIKDFLTLARLDLEVDNPNNPQSSKESVGAVLLTGT